MTDLTNEEKKTMLEKAQEGDPEACYRVSFWALERAEERPDEPKWNKLAVDCLIIAAEGGHEQAGKYLAQLREALGVPEAAEETFVPVFTEEDSFREPVLEDRAKREPVRRRAEAAGTGVGLAALGKGAVEKGKGLVQKAAGLVSGLKDGSAGKGAAEWSEAKWKKVQLMCVIACVVLAFLIVLMLVTGKDSKAEKEDMTMPTPAAAEPVEVTPSPSPVPYPDEATKALIAAAELDIFPEEGDFVSQATTGTVDVNSGLNLRSGPSSSYGQIVLMDADAEVGIYAKKSGWVLVLYGEDTWGWCSEDYLDIN